MTTEELYQFEHWLESGFKGILAGVCASIYGSREAAELVSPRVEIKAILGPTLDHRKTFQDGTNSFDAFEATIEATIVTNRTATELTLTHNGLIGNVRSRLTMRRLLTYWQSSVVAPLDLRGTGTVDTFSDENDIDITTLSYYCVFTVKQTAWPDL